MATTIPGLTITAKSSGDMSSGQYHLVNLSTTNSADGCILGPSTAGGYVVGVWLGNSTAAEHGPVQVSGVSKVQLSSATDAIRLDRDDRPRHRDHLDRRDAGSDRSGARNRFFGLDGDHPVPARYRPQARRDGLRSPDDP
jgi:hypothetical protein